jgi:spermidine/putrescine transport system permease protein
MRGTSSPIRKPRWLALVTWTYLAWSLIPVLLAVQFSFNKGKSRSTWQGFSLRWYTGDPNLSVLHDPTLRIALRNSLLLAALTMLVATPIGVALAIGLARWRSRLAKPANGLMLFPLITPEIVMGVSLFLVFVHLFTFVPRGFTTQLLGHVTFTLSYVVVIVRGRLVAIGRDYEEAARDLGASRLQAIRLVLLPLLAPAIFASLMVVFASSIDDFVISSFLSTGANTETVPIKIYSSQRGTSTPALNALASIMLVLTLIAIAVAAVFTRRMRTGRDSNATALVSLSS